MVGLAPLLLLAAPLLASAVQPLALSRNLNLSQEQSQISDGISAGGPSQGPLHSPSSPPSPCHAPATCTTSPSTITCYGAELPYTSTGPSLLPSSSLEEWEGLREVPGCWAVLQQLLCAAHMPSCSEGRVEKVPRALCRAATRPCRVLAEVLAPLPAFLNCSDDAVYSDHCSEDTRSKRARFNASSRCVAPLLLTRAPAQHFPGLEGCGLPCHSPLLSATEFSSVHSTVAAGAGLSLAASLLAVATFLLDWRGGGRFPALAIFYLNLCLGLAAVGWLAQQVPGARQDIACRADGTARRGEPGQGETLSCTVVFILVYYFSVAAAVWLVILSYCWSVAFTCTPGKAQEVLAARSAYFHMTAWSLPLVLTILVMATNNVDGSAVSGICYVGYTSPLARALFVLVPHTAALAASSYFSWRAVAVLASLAFGVGSRHLSEAAAAKMKATLARIGLFSVLVAACLVTTIGCHAQAWAREEEWALATRRLVHCNLRRRLVGGEECRPEAAPSLPTLQLELAAAFLAGLLASGWVCTRESATTWALAIRGLLCRQQGQRPVRLSKHQIIAQAFSKRNELQANGRLSLSFASAHDDPLGMELGEETSGDFSSAWAAALPHLVTRRAGLCGAEQLGLARRASMDSVSNISRSVSIRSGRFSWLGSRKGSVESADLPRSDLDRLQSIYDETVRGKKRSKRDFFRSHKQKLRPWSRVSGRRRSVTSRTDSNTSSVFSQVLPAITLPAPLGRRTKLVKAALPEPGRSIDFGARPAAAPGGDPSYRELEERLRELATASRNTEREAEGVEVAVQTSLADLRPGVTVGTQVTPRPAHRTVASSTDMTDVGDSLPPLLPAAPPLQHVEANVVNIRVVGPSLSEDSSIPSSYEKDFKMKKLSPRGKENSGEVSVDMEGLSIPALRSLPREGGLLRPRDHHRGRRGAIVQKLSPGAADTTATDS